MVELQMYLGKYTVIIVFHCSPENFVILGYMLFHSSHSSNVLFTLTKSYQMKSDDGVSCLGELSIHFSTHRYAWIYHWIFYYGISSWCYKHLPFLAVRRGKLCLTTYRKTIKISPLVHFCCLHSYSVYFTLKRSNHKG